MVINPPKILKNKSFCFINPPIYDYALYDLFAVQLGILKTISLLKYLGANVYYLDALDKNFDSSFFDKTAIKPTIKPNGTGKYWKKKIKPLKQLEFFDREFYRFGLDFDKIIELIKGKGKFDIIVIASVFTYHYPSLQILVEKIKENFKDCVTILSGIYPKLMTDHAGKLGFDYVFTGDALGFVDFVLNLFSIDTEYHSLLENSSLVYNYDSIKEVMPDWQSMANQKYGIIRLTNGCPYTCPYCASKIISGNYRKLDINYSLNQLKYFSDNRIFNIAFYDDALLIDKDLFLRFIEQANKIDSRFLFYLPNAIHIAKTTKEIIENLTNFKMIRFGLESLNPEDEKYGNKFKIQQLKELLINLNEAKISKDAISFYILVGLPGQTYEEVETTIKNALRIGIKPRIAEYSPIPNTLLFEKAKEELKRKNKNYIDLDDPVFHNPSVYPYIATDFTFENIRKLKKMIYG